MNKKLMTIAGAIALGGVMLGASAYAAISGTSGYDIYKQALKNTYAVQSITPKTEVTVKDNGNLLVKVDATTKVNKADKSMSNSVTVASGNEKKTVDMYRQDEKTITKSSDSDVYSVMEPGMEGKHKRVKGNEDDLSRIKDIENVADALVGNIQNYITLNSNSDGTNEVSLQMSDNQVSPVVNAVASLAIKNAAGRPGHKEYMDKTDSAFGADLQDKIPKLVDNIRVSRVDVNAKINKDNFIQDQTENFIVTGTDANGKTHELSVSINTSFTGYNSTTPDKVDLNGKQVKSVQHEQYRRESE
ncbi:MAG: hypothetical protein ACYC21_01265 [Eubacteriales bacterium]